MRTKGSGPELEAKRRIAARMLQEGNSRAEVARILDVSWTSVDRWFQAVQEHGLKGIAARPHPGRQSRLTEAQEKKVLKVLEQGALKAGFPNDLWNSPRVAEVIYREVGVKYTAAHVLRLLVKWGWSRQKPHRRAREQDREAVSRWQKRELPRIKKGASKES